MRRLPMFATALAACLAGSQAAWATDAANGAPDLPASAAPTSADSTNASAELQLTDFDATVAAAHGYKIVTYPDGSRQSVPIDPNSGLQPSQVLPSSSTSDGGISPNVQSTVYGDCGASFIEGAATGTHKIYLRSGFSLFEAYAPPAIVKWTIELKDKNGTSFQGWSGGVLPKRSWSHEWDGLNQYGYSNDFVEPTSEAILTDGSVCFSVGPSIHIGLPG